MPVVKIKFDRARSFVEDDPETLVKWIPWIGVDIEEVADEYVKIEYNPNRPDYGALPGLMRAYEGIRGYEKGLIEYIAREDSDRYFVKVDASVKNVRPYVVSLVARGIYIDEDLLEEMIGFQEDLHIGIGRKRRKISIGIHNLDVIEFPVRYTTVDENFKFIPLEMEREMSIREILTKHPKGLEYGYIVKGNTRYPMLIDNKDMVLSFPPIINGIYTIVDIGVKNLFIDITGTDYSLVNKALDIIGTTLHDYGAEIYLVKIVDPDLGEYKTPFFEYKKVIVNKMDIQKFIGLKLSDDEIINSLLASRLGVEKEGDRYIVTVPPYRIDILHPVDIIEDIAVGYGFWKIKPELSLFFTAGKISYDTKTIDKIADIMAGLGFLETIHSHLTNPEVMYVMMMKEPDEYIEVEHSKTLTYRILRTWIIPQLLESFSISKKEEYPQKIFEIGKVFTKRNLDGDIHLALGIAHSTANYSEVKSILDEIMNIFKLEYRIERIFHPSFIEGRVGKIIYNDREIGIIGEVHPEVVSNFKIEVPVSVLELNLSSLIGIKNL